MSCFNYLSCFECVSFGLSESCVGKCFIALREVSEMYPGPPYRSFPIPVSHLESSLYRQMRQADIEVLALMQCVTSATVLSLEEETGVLGRKL